MQKPTLQIQFSLLSFHSRAAAEQILDCGTFHSQITSSERILSSKNQLLGRERAQITFEHTRRVEGPLLCQTEIGGRFSKSTERRIPGTANGNPDDLRLLSLWESTDLFLRFIMTRNLPSNLENLQNDFPPVHDKNGLCFCWLKREQQVNKNVDDHKGWSFLAQC